MPIKSFQGERAQKVKPTPSKLLVSDIILDPIVTEFHSVYDGIE